MKNLQLTYQVPISESSVVGGDFIIQGTAINETITTNNHKFTGEELKKAADTLTGVPLLVDHENKVENIKGRVLEGVYNKVGHKVDFKAKVMDLDTQLMIKDGRLNSVSVGAIVEDIDENPDGTLVPKGIIFKELSLVAVPADADATFTIAMKNDFSMMLKEAFTIQKTAIPAIIEKKDKESEIKKCPDCYHKLTPADYFCPNCGKKIKGDRAVADQSQQINPENAEKSVKDVHGAVDSKLLKGGIDRMSEEKQTETVCASADNSKVLMDKIAAMEKTIAELQAKSEQKCKSEDEESDKKDDDEEEEEEDMPKKKAKAKKSEDKKSEDKAVLTNEFFEEKADVKEGYSIVHEGSEFTLVRNTY